MQQDGNDHKTVVYLEIEDIDVWDDNNIVFMKFGEVTVKCDIYTAQELRNMLTSILTSIDL